MTACSLAGVEPDPEWQAIALTGSAHRNRGSSGPIGKYVGGVPRFDDGDVMPLVVDDIYRSDEATRTKELEYQPATPALRSA